MLTVFDMLKRCTDSEKTGSKLESTPSYLADIFALEVAEDGLGESAGRQEAQDGDGLRRYRLTPV